MKKIFSSVTSALALLGLGLAGCQPDLEKDVNVSAGAVDFTTYVAVGNSLTAGFSDGGLYLEGQQNSYPNLLAQQFKFVGGGDFAQPLFQQGQENGSGYLSLTGLTPAGLPILTPVTDKLALRAGSAPGKPLYTKYPDPVNNLGVPGIRMADINTPGYGSVKGNPYFERITPDANPLQTYLQRVQAATPTFFTEWLGNNDVLGFSASGGAFAAASPANSITSTKVFTDNANAVLDALTANGAKGIVGLIPDVTTIPFFNTVGPQLRATLVAKGVPGIVITSGDFTAGPTAIKRMPVDTADIRNARGGRQLFTLTSAPYLPLLGTPSGKAWRDVYAQLGLPASGFAPFLQAFEVDTTKAFGLTAGNPFPTSLVLDNTEQSLVQKATGDFNKALRAKAADKGLAVFDANAFFTVVATNGFATNGVSNTAGFVSGNLFSLDGVHPTPRGYAVVANEMIKAINAQYGANVPQLDPNNYRGVRFP